ncbi:hypothetical protein ACA910_006038 [Epithemia clementina (nom. ined.)]
MSAAAEKATPDTGAKSGKQSKTRKGRQHKRRKISKHVLKSLEEKVTVEGKSTPEPTSDKKKKKKKPKVVKDPGDVYGYLTNWKRHKDEGEDGTSWKFNKNTQSWLIRHMFEVDKVPKSTFSLLLEYLNGLKSPEARKRIVADATRRALRYKEYEEAMKKETDVSSSQEKDEEHTKNDDDEAKDASTPTAAANNDDSDKSKSESQDEDAARWKQLDDHDKRKEYKRARRVLESLSSDKS